MTIRYNKKQNNKSVATASMIGMAMYFYHGLSQASSEQILEALEATKLSHSNTTAMDEQI